MNLEVQILWQGTALCESRSAGFVAGAALCEPPCEIAWQAQYFVNLHVQSSWQAQHFVNLHAAPNLDGEAPRNDGCETVSGHGRIMVGSFSESSPMVIRVLTCFLTRRCRGRRSTL